MRVRHSNGASQRGFTLMELVIVMTVVAVLATIAIPSYTAYLDRGKRAAAKGALLDATAFLERSHATNGCYNYATVAACQSQSGTVMTLPAPLTRAPNEGRASYALTVSYSGSTTGQAFTLTATPCGSTSCAASSDPFVDNTCGSFTLNQTGTRGVTGTGGVGDCWQR